MWLRGRVRLRALTLLPVVVAVACSGHPSGTIVIARQSAENDAIARGNASLGPGMTVFYPLVDVRGQTGNLVVEKRLGLGPIAVSVKPGRYEVIYRSSPQDDRGNGAS
jgi:hypothetical protein